MQCKTRGDGGSGIDLQQLCVCVGENGAAEVFTDAALSSLPDVVPGILIVFLP